MTGMAGIRTYHMHARRVRARSMARGRWQIRSQEGGRRWFAFGRSRQRAVGWRYACTSTSFASDSGSMSSERCLKPKETRCTGQREGSQLDERKGRITHGFSLAMRLGYLPCRRIDGRV